MQKLVKEFTSLLLYSTVLYPCGQLPQFYIGKKRKSEKLKQIF